jgi:hypothetical protein
LRSDEFPFDNCRILPNIIILAKSIQISENK